MANQKISIGVIVLIALFLGACKKIEPFPRDNPYDINRTEGDFKFEIDYVEIVEESVSDNGILNSLEKMYLQVYIKNTGTEPGKVSNAFFTEVETGTLDFEPQQTISGIGDFTGDFVVQDFIEPGQSAMVYAGETPDSNTPYSIRVEKRALASAPSEVGEVRLEDFYGNTWKMQFTINVN